MSCCRATGGRIRPRAVRQPDHGGDQRVFTIGDVANLLGDDEDWLFDPVDRHSRKTVVFGSTVSARMACPPSPETASKTCARSSPMRELPTADRPPRRRSQPPAVITACYGERHDPAPSYNGKSVERRRAVRQELSAPLVADLERWLREERPKLSRHAGPPRRSTTRSSAGRPSFAGGRDDRAIRQCLRANRQRMQPLASLVESLGVQHGIRPHHPWPERRTLGPDHSS